MSPDPDPGAVPSAKGMGGAFIEHGIPLVFGLAGFLGGDFANLNGVIYDVSGGILNNLPGSYQGGGKLDYYALLAAGAWGAVAVIWGMGAPKLVGSGYWRTVLIKSVKWFIIGVALRDAAYGVLGPSVGFGNAGMLAIPTPGGA